MIRYLPSNVALQYSELLQLCLSPAPDGANLSFKQKNIGSKTYWYLYISIGVRRSEHYLGEDSEALRQQISKEKALWQQNSEDRQLRARLVAMLQAGGAAPLLPEEGKVLALLEKTGVFLLGGVLIGSHAFQAYANMLGVAWGSYARTQDIDLARERELPIAVPATSSTIPLKQILTESGMGFLEVPSLDYKSPSTRFKIQGKPLSVELLTPMVGKQSKPVHITSLNAYAEPVRYIDYLLDDTQIAVLLYRHGILVHVPNPARFALHKLVVSQRRTSAFAEKSRKDIQQAAALLEILCEDRPGEVLMAYDAAVATGGKFLKQMQQGMALLAPELLAALDDVLT